MFSVHELLASKFPRELETSKSQPISSHSVLPNLGTMKQTENSGAGCDTDVIGVCRSPVSWLEGSSKLLRAGIEVIAFVNPRVRLGRTYSLNQLW